MRSIAAVCGMLLYLGAKGAGVAIPALLLSALTTGRFYLSGIVGALLPAAVGFLVAWFVTGYFNSRNARKNLVGMRILAMTMSAVVLLYADCCLAALSPSQSGDGALLMPNLVFVLAILLYAVFRYHPLPDDAAVSEDATARPFPDANQAKAK